MPRGPKRNLLAQRDKRGRIDSGWRDAMTEREAVSVALEARIRLFGIPAEHAITTRDGVNAGTVIGRMTMAQALTKDQWSALSWWNDRRLEYHSALLLKKEGSSGAGPGNNGEDSDSYADWCREKVKLWDQIRDVLQDAANETRSQVFAALDYMVVRDEYHAHFEGPLRYAANAIHRRFLQGRR